MLPATESEAAWGPWTRAEVFLDRMCTRSDSYSVWLSPAFVFLPLLILNLLTTSGEGPQSPDPLAAAIPAWQFGVHGNFNLDAFEGMLPWFVEGREHVVSDRNPGVIFFAIPFYWLFARFTDEPSLIPAAFASAVAAAGAMTVLHTLFRRFVPAPTAILGAIIAGLGTASWSVSTDGLWPHGINPLWFTSALAFLAAGGLFAGGAFFGVAIFTRPQTAFAAVQLHQETGIQPPRGTTSTKPPNPAMRRRTLPPEEVPPVAVWCGP